MKPPPPKPEHLIATIERTDQTYYLSQPRDDGDVVDDEAILDVVGKIEEISPRHKRFVGQQIEMSFACSRRFGKDVGEGEGKPFLLSMNLKKNGCSFMAYLPSDAF